MSEKIYTQKDMDEIMDKSFEAGKKINNGHVKSSPETRERLVSLETNYKNFMEQNTKEHAEIKQMICEIKDDLKEAIDNKANKWTEKVLIGAGSAIGLGFLSLIGWLIVEAIRRFQ